MEQVFYLESGSRICLCEEGNHILLCYLQSMKNANWAILEKDYQRNICFEENKTGIYVAYINLNKEMVLRQVGKEQHVILYVEQEWLVHEIALVSCGDNLYVCFCVEHKDTGKMEIRYMAPELNRKERMLYSFDNNKGLQTERVNGFHIVEINDKKYLCFSSQNEEAILEIKEKDAGELIYEKTTLCKQKIIKDLDERCKQSHEEYIKSVKKMEKEYETKLKKQAKDIETEYRKQYDELANLTKEIQKEGKRWRSMYQEVFEEIKQLRQNNFGEQIETKSNQKADDQIESKSKNDTES